MKISGSDKKYLRYLAKKQLEYANLPIMQQRTKQWYRHNCLQGDRPMLVMEMLTFADDVLPYCRFADPDLKQLEKQLLLNIVNHEIIDDDKVVPDYISIDWDVTFRLFDYDIQFESANDDNSKSLGKHWLHPITDIKSQIDEIKNSTFAVDKEKTNKRKELFEDLIGDILPVRIENKSLEWIFAPMAQIVFLIGMEKMLMSIIDSPDTFNSLAGRIVDEMLRYLRWQEQQSILTLNNQNHYVGAGSYGFTKELPVNKTSKITSKDLWGNMNSQETVGLSPSMYKEFVFPHYKRLAEEFGLVYYGCCEPVHDIWDDCIIKLPNLRKVSISPWCNEQFMGQKLKNSNIIYSRKPSPNFIGVDGFDERGYTEHIKSTLKAAKGCSLEIIHRDIYTLNGDKERPGRAIKLARKMIDENW